MTCLGVVLKTRFFLVGLLVVLLLSYCGEGGGTECCSSRRGDRRGMIMVALDIGFSVVEVGGGLEACSNLSGEASIVGGIDNGGADSDSKSSLRSVYDETVVTEDEVGKVIDDMGGGECGCISGSGKVCEGSLPLLETTVEMLLPSLEATSKLSLPFVAVLSTCKSE